MLIKEIFQTLKGALSLHYSCFICGISLEYPII